MQSWIPGSHTSDLVERSLPFSQSRRPTLSQRFQRHRAAVISLVVICILVLGAILADSITPYDAFDIDTNSVNLAPGMRHLMGTDDLGRDEFTRVLRGGRVSLTVGVLAVVISFPSLILMMIFAALLGKGIVSIALVIGLTSWMTVARLVRASFLSLKKQEFVMAAVSIGMSDTRIATRHILPNAL